MLPSIKQWIPVMITATIFTATVTTTAIDDFS